MTHRSSRRARTNDAPAQSARLNIRRAHVVYLGPGAYLYCAVCGRVEPISECGGTVVNARWVRPLDSSGSTAYVQN